MDMRQIVSRIDQRLSELGITAAEVSKRATGSPDTIRNWRRKVAAGSKAGASLRTLEPVARELGIDFSDLIESAGVTAPGSTVSGPVPMPAGRLPFAGIVRAGWFRPVDELYSQDPADHLAPPSIPRHPAYLHLPQRAYRIEGDSMVLAGMHDGMWAVATPYLDYIDKVGELDNGNYVVVERLTEGGSTAEITVKEVQFARSGMRLVPRSNNKDYEEFFIPLDPDADPDEELVAIKDVVLWAVKDMDPRSR